MDRKNLDKAFDALHRIKFLQAMAFSAQNDLDNDYKIIDYADMMNDFVVQLQESLDGIERDASTQSEAEKKGTQ